MADEKKTPPSEFTLFVRDIGIKAFDTLSDRVSERTTESGANTLKASAATAVNKLAGYWATMSEGEKEKFFDQMISAAQLVAASAPAMVAGFQRTKPKKDVKKKGTASIEALEASIPKASRKPKDKDKDKNKTKKKKKHVKEGKKSDKKA